MDTDASKGGWYLRTALDTKTSPVFRSSLFTEPLLFDKLSELVVCGTEHELQSTSSTMAPTGIPPHCVLMSWMAKLQKQMNDAEKRAIERHRTDDELVKIMIEAIDSVDMQRGQMTLSSVKDVLTGLLEEKLAPIEMKIGQTNSSTPTMVHFVHNGGA